MGLIDLYCLTSCQKSFHFYGNVTTASEGQQNLVTLHDLQVGRSEILIVMPHNSQCFLSASKEIFHLAGPWECGLKQQDPLVCHKR